ncbi:MAG: hypothetical protein IIA41_14385 [SAR324 cluster bacterium]|nr:hypothetical protein [SAR324 cluster bacterium]
MGILLLGVYVVLFVSAYLISLMGISVGGPVEFKQRMHLRGRWPRLWGLPS